MIKVTPIQTGTVSIRPHHHCGEEDHGPVRRKIAMILDHEWVEDLPIYTYLIEHPEGNYLVDSGDSADNTAKDYLPAWTRFSGMAWWSRLRRARRWETNYALWG